MHEINRRTLIATGLAGTLAVPAMAATDPHPSDPDFTVPLWPGMDPAAPGAANVFERPSPAFRDRAVDRIKAPWLAGFRAASPNGAAMLIMPGGGYERVVVDKEGFELAAWLTARGIAAYVLYYRLPGEGWADASNVPLADAQRAMRLIRARAAADKVDAARVGAIGFSAGGHLCADLATRHMRQLYKPVDAADALDARPAIAAPIYPVVSMDPAIAHMGSRAKLLGANPSAEAELEHSPDRQVSAATPPCFLCHAEDDGTVNPDNTLRLRAALKAAGVAVETHLFEDGGHGFGLRLSEGKPVAAWPELFLSWARSKGLTG